MKVVFISLCFVILSGLALHSQNVPITSTGTVTNAVPGGPSVPVAVTAKGFTDIGQFTLTMQFDTTRVHFVSAGTNPSLSGMTFIYTHPSGNTLGQLVFSWTGTSNVSLADGSSLANLTFSYISGTGILSWAYTFGSVCQYKRFVGGMLTSLADTPKYHFFLSGGISNRAAPVTLAPDIPDPVPGPLPVPVKVYGFYNIGGLTLYLEYDPAVITYQNSFTKNPAFDSNFLVGDNTGSGGKRQIVMQWFGNELNLDDGSTLCTLNFSYPLASCAPCALNWLDNGSSCEYADGPGDVLIDMPQAEYYINGFIRAILPVTWTGNINSAWDNAGNWNSCGLPDITRDIVIPNVSPNPFPVVTQQCYCRSIRIETGATMNVSITGSITIGKN